MKKNIPIILVIIAIVTSLFYWFEIRPISIKKECLTEAQNKQNNFYQTYTDLLSDGVETEEPDLEKIFETEYKKCLIEKGINE